VLGDRYCILLVFLLGICGFFPSEFCVLSRYFLIVLQVEAVEAVEKQRSGDIVYRPKSSDGSACPAFDEACGQNGWFFVYLVRLLCEKKGG